MKNCLLLVIIIAFWSCNLENSPVDSASNSMETSINHHKHDKGHDHDHHEHDDHSHDHENGYNAELAKELGADDYGMRKYVMAFLKAGPNRNQSEEEANEMQVAHMNNIQRMADEGLLVLAGPFIENKTLSGIYVFDVSTIEEARKLTESDPMIQSGRLEMELTSWYGSAALKKVNEIHDKIQNVNISAE